MLAAVLGVLPVAVFDPKLVPLILVLGAGFLIGTFGHIVKSRTLVIIGIGLIFLVTVLIPLLFFDAVPAGP
ncbi:MAG: hypothetical protein QOK31_1921 [Solirubrobacteraceae bacterium]|jgi:hypothetical protein|nr:hypothetical protein [Solirubrobacteraceae bacterium]